MISTPIYHVLKYIDLAHEIQRFRDKNLNLAAQYGALLRKLGSVLGILQDDPENFLQMRSASVDVQKIEKLIQARNEARASKNWSEADRIRKELSDMSVILEDAAGVTTWKAK